MKTLLATIATLVLAVSIQAQSAEYKIQTDAPGMDRFLTDIHQIIPEHSVGGPTKYIVESYCRRMLDIPRAGKGKQDNLVGYGLIFPGNGQIITICVTKQEVIPTEAYGYLCDLVDMKFDRIEGRSIVCHGDTPVLTTAKYGA